LIRENEHPELTERNDADLNDEERKELRYFKPAFLSAEEWDDDVIEETIANL